MATNAVNTIHAINSDDLTRESSTQLYPIGLRVKVVNSSYYNEQEYIYVKAHGSLTQYQSYILKYDGATSLMLKTAAPATGAATVVVPQIAVTSAYYAFVLVKGEGSCKVSTETYAAGDQLEVLTTGTTAMVDGTSGATVRTVRSFAVSKATGTTAASVAVYLYGNSITTIAAT